MTQQILYLSRAYVCSINKLRQQMLEEEEEEKEERKARGTKAAYILLGGGADFTLIQNCIK